MSAAVSLPADAEAEPRLVAWTCFEIARRQLEHWRGVAFEIQRESDDVLDRLETARAEVEQWAELAEESARVVAQGAE